MSTPPDGSLSRSTQPARALLCGTATGLILAAAACGSTSSSTSSSSPRSAGRSSEAEASRSAEQILADAASALQASHSFKAHVVAHDHDGDLVIDMTVASAGEAAGTVTRKGATGDFVDSGGKVYLHGRAFLTAVASAQFASTVGDRWLVLGTGDFNAGLQDLVDPQKLGQCYASQHGPLTKGGTQQLDGTAAIVVTDAGSQPNTAHASFYVAASGTPNLLQVMVSGPGDGTLLPACETGLDGSMTSVTVDFSGFGATYTVSVPTATFVP